MEDRMEDQGAEKGTLYALANEYKYNDTYNAQKLIEMHGDDVLYVEGWGWMVWDGKRWKRDQNAVIALAQDTLQKLGVQALQMPNSKERDTLLVHVSRSLNYRNLRDMVSVAATDKRIQREASEFDKNPELLNAQNGTIDLRTGELRPFDRNDLITQVVACEYNPDAQFDEWEDFMLWAANGREDLRDYTQEAIGYSLTGLTSERALFLAYGPVGANGKSTILETVLYVAGDYGAMTRVETVLTKNDKSDGIPADLAALAGKRFVITSETEQGQGFRTAQMKRITGADTVQARFMNQNYFTFRPQMKLWLGTNSKPEVREGGQAVWTRIKMLPFDNTVPPERRDGTLGPRLREHAEAVLAWAVRGSVRYLKRGRLPDEPECMQSVRAEYEAEQDPFRAFVEERCEMDPDAWTPTKGGLLKGYEDWYLATYGKAAYTTANKFHEMAAQHGYRKVRKATGMGIQGLRLIQY